MSSPAQEKPSPASADRSMLAIVMAADATPPPREALAGAIRARLPDVELPPDLADQQHRTLLFFIRGVMCGIMPMDLPCPLSAQHPPFTTAWYWPQAWDTVKDHKTHLNVFATGGDDARLRAVLLGQLVAAAVEATPSALAAHWATSNAIWPAHVVPRMAAPGSDAPPIPLCVAVALSRDASGAVSGITQGLAAFGLMEIESLGYAGAPTDLNGLLLDLAAYLINSGAVLKDGETVGPDANTKWRVRHEVSRFLPGRKVYRVYFA